VASEILTQILPVRTFVLSFINKITHPWALNLFPLVGRSLVEEAWNPLPNVLNRAQSRSRLLIKGR
jgi:hypothetical protein